MIDKQTVEDIRNKADIVSIISEYVPLKKRGRNYLGLCPFHSEKTASFTVSPEKQLFHCFGCGEGGNVFTFLMKVENIGFGEALSELGEKTGIVVKKPAAFAAGPSPSEKNKIYDACALAARFFRSQLEAVGGSATQDYLKKRGIGEAIGKEFGLGFAPAGWDGLFRHLIERGVSPKIIEQAGLILPREGGDGYYDRFRNRLMFPILDLRGRAIGFSGRSLDNSDPKYLNSPDTPVYHKGETIFGLNLAKENIKKEKFAVLVEGNVDLIALHQAGLNNSAAPLGTALTAQQCKLLARLCDTFVLAFDADAAGISATERAAEVLRGQGLKVKVAEFTGAKDPDEFIGKMGADAFKQAIKIALPFIEFKIRKVLAQNNLAEIDGRSQAFSAIAKVLGGESDPFAQREYAKLAALALKTDPEALLAEVKRLGFYRQGKNTDLRRFTEKPGSRLDSAERKLIALAAQSPESLAAVKKEVGLDGFSGGLARKAAEIVYAGATQFEEITDEAIKNYLTGALISENLENPAEILHDCVQALRAEGQKREVDELKTGLRQAEASKDERKAAEIIAAINNLAQK